jgi:hypothetical protein
MSSVGLPGRSGVGAPSPDGKGLGPHSPTSPATPNPTGQSPRAALPISSARAEASRKNGAGSRGPKTPEGAAWRLARADRIEAELFAERRFAHGGLGLALIRDGNGTRSLETLLRYRGAAMAEFWRALRTLKALQAEQAATVAAAAPAPVEPRRPGLRSEIDHRSQPNEPEHYGQRDQALEPEPPTPGRSLHEGPAPWTPNEPDRQRAGPAHAQADAPESNEPQPHAQPPSRGTFSQPFGSAPAAAAPGASRADLRAPGAGGS